MSLIRYLHISRTIKSVLCQSPPFPDAFSPFYLATMFSFRFNALVACATAFTGALAQSESVYRPANHNTLCLTSDGPPGRGSRVVVMDCDSVDSTQRSWTIQKQSNGQTNVMMNTWCLDTIGGNYKNGTAIQLYDCNGLAPQNWTYSNDL